MHWDANKIFQVLPFYDAYIEKPKVKKLSNVQLLKKLTFYDDLSIVKIRQYLVVMLKVVKLKFLTKQILQFN